MTIYLPEGLQWLAWVAGTTWPKGDEDAAWAASEAWKTASKELEALLAGIDEAEQATVAAYPQGEGGAAMGARYDVLRTGDQSLEALAQLMSTVGDSAFDMGTEIQATKITVIVTLAWLALEILWAWLFPPTAPAVEAAAITTTRSFLKVFEDFVQKIITNIAARLGAPTVKRHFWTRAVQLRPVLPTAKGYGVYGARAIEAAAITGTINGAVQVGQLAAGKRRHFNGGEFGLSILAGVAGVIPGREFGRYLGKGIDKIAGKNLDNAFGRVGRGVVIGGGPPARRPPRGGRGGGGGARGVGGGG
uniref:WXG100-like domain-containing protein n=1 Tax=Nocardia abscessus TaxID=120957 RepID=UPI0024541D4E